MLDSIGDKIKQKEKRMFEIMVEKQEKIEALSRLARKVLELHNKQEEITQEEFMSNFVQLCKKIEEELKDKR